MGVAIDRSKPHGRARGENIKRFFCVFDSFRQSLRWGDFPSVSRQNRHSGPRSAKRFAVAVPPIVLFVGEL